MVFILVPDFPSRASRNPLFYFSQIFLLYFSPNRDHTRWNHKNFHLKQRWDVVYRKTDMFAETRAIT